MQAPQPTRIFHITALDNLADICKAGALLSKNAGAVNGIRYQNIAHAGAQGTRSQRTVPTPPGGVIHDYVPFYFAPRSPMLYAINGGRVDCCELRQADIVHFETTVQVVAQLSPDIIFYDRNATLQFSQSYTDLTHLNSVVAWDLLTEEPQLDGYCKFWQNRADPPRYADRMERRMAEFLVKDRVPLSGMTRLGVIDSDRQSRAKFILQQTGIALNVAVMPDWYF
jgi:hypothetical protein